MTGRLLEKLNILEFGISYDFAQASKAHNNLLIKHLRNKGAG